MRLRILAVGLLSLAIAAVPLAAEEPTVDEARKALRRGVEYFRNNVSIEGGYLWRYAADFSEREGETPASPTTAWVQPPGTPTVGETYLDAYELTGDAYYLEAARETALALVRGQLKSGGWDYRVEFAEKDREKYAYRADNDDGKKAKASKSRLARNTTTLDDDTTQAALRFLMRVDRALDFQNQPIHESAKFALRSLIDAQYPNGAWPQRFSSPPDAKQFPVKQASYPAEWSRTYPAVDYKIYYTSNYNTISYMIYLMFRAAEIYGDPKYTAAAERAGDFILLAQMPQPQPGWAQQYDAEMHPAWARKFEPPALSGGESQGVMRTLMKLYAQTGKERFLEPIPRALAYYRSSERPDGRMARFYELHTNKPLYFTKDYQLTYSDDDMPTHYGFITSSRLDDIEREYERWKKNGPPNEPRKLTAPPTAPRMTDKLRQQAAAVIAAQDASGAWIEPAPRRQRSKIPADAPSLSCRTFCRNVEILAQFIVAAKKPN